MTLARLHWDMTLDQTLSLDVVGSLWTPADLERLLTGAGFDLERAEGDPPDVRLTARRIRTLPDTVGPGMAVLVCGLNPSVGSADAGYGYAGRNNRFWPAAMAAGLVSRPRDPVHAVEVDGVGITDLVKRPTPSARELAPQEYRTGLERVRWLVAWLRPGVVLFVGLAGWRAAVARGAAPGWQPGGLGSTPAYVMPSTSGLNARTSRAELVGHMRAALSEARRRRGLS